MLYMAAVAFVYISYPIFKHYIHTGPMRSLFLAAFFLHVGKRDLYFSQFILATLLWFQCYLAHTSP